VTGEIYKARAELRKKSMPKPPPTPPSRPLLCRPRKKHPIPQKLAVHRTAIARVYALHKQGVSIRGIRRRTGHSRNTIKRWLRGEIPKEVSEGELPTEWMLEEIFGRGVASGQEEEPLIPEVSSPWSSWEEVRKVRNLLCDVRYIILRRPEHLTEKDREKLGFLLDSPLGNEVRLRRGFLEEWYLLFHEEQHKWRTLAEAKERYDRLKNNPDYQKLKHLAGLQARFCEEHFLKVSRFLMQDGWEATNNGAERTGRTFRHLQRSRYNFRKPISIENALRARAWLAKQGSSPRSTRLASPSTTTGWRGVALAFRPLSEGTGKRHRARIRARLGTKRSIPSTSITQCLFGGSVSQRCVHQDEGLLRKPSPAPVKH
jgi:hypothetical protein